MSFMSHELTIDCPINPVKPITMQITATVLSVHRPFLESDSPSIEPFLRTQSCLSEALPTTTKCTRLNNSTEAALTTPHLLDHDAAVLDKIDSGIFSKLTR